LQFRHHRTHRSTRDRLPRYPAPPTPLACGFGGIFLDTLNAIKLATPENPAPLIILAAFAGVPCVATDVDACRELIFGLTPQDKTLGRAGLLTKICSPLDTAGALLCVISSTENLRIMGQAGRTRAAHHYRQTEVMGKYRSFLTDHAWATDAATFTLQFSTPP
jgi:glycosyltransferase involved in cell wall biosynthesis